MVHRRLIAVNLFTGADAESRHAGVPATQIKDTDCTDGHGLEDKPSRLPANHGGYEGADVDGEEAGGGLRIYAVERSAQTRSSWAT